MIDLLLFLMLGIFVAGRMVSRTAEYLGEKKIGGREMKLANNRAADPSRP